MRSPLSKIPFPVALALGLAAALPPPAAAETVAPLPESNYAVRPACSEAPPGFATCQADQLIPLSAEAKSHSHPIGMVRPAARARPSVPSPKTGELGLRPQDIHTVYGLPTTPPIAQTIAIVDAYNDPTAEADLKTYSEEFSLPLCTKANGCFSQVSQESGAPLPFPKTTAELEELEGSSTTATKEQGEEVAGWGVEMSLDIESAHATCQTCHIVLVEANTPATEDLTAAELRAEALGATVISNSWGAAEEGIEAASDQKAPFNDPGIVITASAGDDGYRNWGAAHASERNVTQYPASSPHVVSVGGTRLSPLGLGGTWEGESVWNGSGAGGGGCSVLFAAPAWQQQVADWTSIGCSGQRSVADVSADADPYSGVVIFDSDAPGALCRTKYTEGKTAHTLEHWCTYGGTSLASPIVASTFALAGGANGIAHPAETLYANEHNAPGVFHDITAGSNGRCSSYNHTTGLSNCTAAEEAAASCSGTYACLATTGYDGPSGVGTPNGVRGFIPGQHEELAGAEAAPATGGSEPARTVTAPATEAGPATTPTVASVKLTALALTAPALTALSRHAASARSISFAFAVNAAVKVRVVLMRLVRSHGRTRWVAVGHASTIAAVAGRNVRRLSGAARLPKGRYRLTLTPAGGAARSVTFTIR
jgi:hypothetical protein